MDDLPDIPMHNILCRLPIQHLMRCRSVCKSWLRVIDDPYFQSHHLGFEEHVGAFGCVYGDEGSGPTFYKLVRKGDEMTAKHITCFPELDLPGWCQYSCKMQSCNGFIHFERYDESGIVEVAVVNPLTREIVRVQGSPYHAVYFYNMSLGYDPSSRTYKLVQLLVLDGQNQLAAAIYDLGGGGGWRCCLVPPELFISEDGLPDAGICISGTLNWISHRSRRRGRIVVFDLSREEFREVRSPVNLRDFNADVELVDVGGSLALLDFSKKVYVRMWVLGESGWIRKPRILIGPWPRASTDYILGVYYYEESLVFWEYRHKLVQQKKKRKRGKKFKIEIKSEEELYFINASDNNDLFLDKLPGVLQKFCSRLNFARLVSG